MWDTVYSIATAAWPVIMRVPLKMKSIHLWVNTFWLVSKLTLPLLQRLHTSLEWWDMHLFGQIILLRYDTDVVSFPAVVFYLLSLGYCINNMLLFCWGNYSWEFLVMNCSLLRLSHSTELYMATESELVIYTQLSTNSWRKRVK